MCQLLHDIVALLNKIDHPNEFIGDSDTQIYIEVRHFQDEQHMPAFEALSRLYGVDIGDLIPLVVRLGVYHESRSTFQWWGTKSIIRCENMKGYQLYIMVERREKTMDA